MHSCQTVNCDIIDMSIYYSIYYDVMVMHIMIVLESSVGFVVFKQPRGCKSAQSHIVQSSVSQSQALLISNRLWTQPVTRN